MFLTICVFFNISFSEVIFSILCMLHMAQMLKFRIFCMPMMTYFDPFILVLNQIMFDRNIFNPYFENYNICINLNQNIKHYGGFV